MLTDLILIRGALSSMAQRLGDQETQKAITCMTGAGHDQQTAREVYSAVSELVRGSVLLTGVGQKHNAAAEIESSDGDGPAAAASIPGNPAFELLLTSVLAHVGGRFAE